MTMAESHQLRNAIENDKFRVCFLFNKKLNQKQQQQQNRGVLCAIVRINTDELRSFLFANFMAIWCKNSIFFVFNSASVYLTDDLFLTCLNDLWMECVRIFSETKKKLI